MHRHESEWISKRNASLKQQLMLIVSLLLNGIVEVYLKTINEYCTRHGKGKLSGFF